MIGTYIARPLYWLAGRVFALWARPVIQPDAPPALLTDPGAAVCYVLETGGLADLLALEQACARAGMPSPTAPLAYGEFRERSSFVVLHRSKGFLVRRPAPEGSKRLRRLVDAAGGENPQALLLIPVAIYWGRAPDKDRSLMKLMFAENWELVGRTRKFLTTLVLGRSTLLRYSDALPVRAIVEEGIDRTLAFRKVSRILRVHFRQRRIATVGPDLSHRRTLIEQVLMGQGVQAAIAAEGGDDPAALAAARRKAREYALEIAADISYPTVRVVERFLRWLWHRIYDGIELSHVQRIHDVARGSEIVYVPCHRSHFDYMLLSYIVYHQGLHIPHVAAGINLNLPVVGAILRRGGAFYLRRSFKGNRLYAAVFDAYLHKLLTRGFSIEYYVEGGRSRTGRLLPPKGGMLAMTVGSYVRDPRRPIVFVPLYFGYERLAEGHAFINELGGGEKKRESLFGLIRSVRALKEHFGKVYVNVAEPIELPALLDRLHPDWRHETWNGERPAWLARVIDELGDTIMHRINTAAAVTPIGLLACVLLATPKQRIGLDELRRQLQLSKDLLRRFRYSSSVTIPELTPDEIIAHGVRMQAIDRTEHPMGPVVSMSEKTAVLMTYFRNNILHLFAMPAAVACCFIQGQELEQAELRRLARLIYPFMQKELWLKWDYDGLDAVTDVAIDTLVEMGLLSRGESPDILVRPPAGSARAYQLLMLGQLMVPMLQRFYLVIAILARNGPGTLSRARLEVLCKQSAERLSMIYGLHSPDFFNQTLFQDFIRMLQDQDVLRRNADGKLDFDEGIESIGADARLVLGEEIRHSILSLTAVESADDAGARTA
ncbi:MAG TPA: glycerol-3-phosphate 1-O-acyltransferase PlsB [Woeseiaceae bacterium]|nr:glycerol-3-phosphate 1-O-acyltransferase PlsB [Woeseiaceae bacterium]